MSEEELKVIKEQREKANEIITLVKEDLYSAIENIEKDNYDKAIKDINQGLSRTDCPVCHRELGILVADIEHNKAICHLGSEFCEDEKNVIIEHAKKVAEEFTPLDD